MTAWLFPNQSCFSHTLQISNRRANHKMPRLHTEPGTIQAWLGVERWQEFLGTCGSSWWPTARLPVRLGSQTLLFCGGGSRPCHTQAHSTSYCTHTLLKRHTCPVHTCTTDYPSLTSFASAVQSKVRELEEKCRVQSEQFNLLSRDLEKFRQHAGSIDLLGSNSVALLNVPLAPGKPFSQYMNGLATSIHKGK